MTEQAIAMRDVGGTDPSPWLDAELFTEMRTQVARPFWSESLANEDTTCSLNGYPQKGTR